jgi:hypothetical protein
VAAILLLTAAFALPFATGTAEKAYAATDGDYEYSVSDGRATITGYNGTSTEIVVPATLGGYPVVSVVLIKEEITALDISQATNLTSLSCSNNNLKRA